MNTYCKLFNNLSTAHATSTSNLGRKFLTILTTSFSYELSFFGITHTLAAVLGIFFFFDMAISSHGTRITYTSHKISQTLKLHLTRISKVLIHSHDFSYNSHAIPFDSHEISYNSHEVSKILMGSHTILTRSHTILMRSHTILTRSHTIPMRSHTILTRSHTILMRSHTILTRSHTVLMRSHTMSIASLN